MSPERVLAKDRESGRYVLIAASASKEIPGTTDRMICVYQKYPTMDFDPSDLSKIETGLFNMRTLHNSRYVDVYRVFLQDDGNKLERYSLLSGASGLLASDIRTLAICQKLAVEYFCKESGLEIIQRF